MRLSRISDYLQQAEGALPFAVHPEQTG